MTIFPFFTIFMLFIVFLAIRYKQLDNIQKEQENTFWEKERKANATPAVDLTNLNYITIPLERFPLHSTSDETINSIERELEELSTHRLLNLTGITNTDLKATYGVPNFETMQKIGDDFDRLTVLLQEYAQALLASEMTSEAVKVLEYAAAIKTDSAKSYKLLADLYNEKGDTRKLSSLRDLIAGTNLMLKPAILEYIDKYLNSTEEDISTADTTQSTDTQN